jgi:tetratricopeptide (TPR) repeat protein
MTQEWFRNTEWNDDIAKEFEARLRRAKKKGQYLRIQALTIARTKPEIALALLDRYFEDADQVDEAQAHTDRATAYIALGRHEEAVSAYEAALRREEEFPHLLTQAYIELPYLVAVNGLSSHYGRALELLDKHRDRLVFPVERFKWNAARALIAGALGNLPSARESARKALEAAAERNSGFTNHPSIGLVSDEHRQALTKLTQYKNS